MILSPHLVTLIVGIYFEEILQKKEQEMCAQILLAGLSSLGENCKQSKCQQREGLLREFQTITLLKRITTQTL